MLFLLVLIVVIATWIWVFTSAKARINSGELARMLETPQTHSTRTLRLVTAAATIGAMLVLPLTSAVSAAQGTSIIPMTDPYGISADGAHVWVTNPVEKTVSEMDPSTDLIEATIDVGVDPYAVSSDGSNVWVTNSGSDTVTEISASTGSTRTISVGHFPYGIHSDGTDVWVANYLSSTVSRLNAHTGSVLATISVGQYPSAVFSDRTHVWVANSGNYTVSEIDISTDSVIATIPVAQAYPGPYGITATGSDIWVANSGSNTVSVISRATKLVKANLTVGQNPARMTSDENHVWVTNGASDTLSEIDPTTGSVVATIQTGHGPNGVTSDGTYVWVANAGTGGGITKYQIPRSPGPPSGVTAIVGNTQASIAWTDGASNGSAISSQTIYVYLSGSLVSTKTNCTGSPCTVTGLTNGTSYTFKVSDTNDVGEGALSGASSAVTPATYPGSPQNVTVVAAGGQAVVSWTPPISNGGSPIISYSVSTGGHSCSYTVSSPETDTCTITGLTNGSSYTFSVTATNGVGTGSASTGGPATVLFPAPVLTSAVAGMHQITLTWTAPTVTDGKIVSFTGSAGDGHGHNFYCSGAKSATKCTITGLTDLTTYTTSVKATENKGGTISASSNTISATPAEPLTLPYLHPVTLTSNPHTVTIIWGSASGGDGQTPSYRLKVFNSDGSTFYSTQTTGNTATASGLTKGAKYTYTITTSTDASVAGWIPAVTTKAVKFTAK